MATILLLESPVFCVSSVPLELQKPKDIIRDSCEQDCCHTTGFVLALNMIIQSQLAAEQGCLGLRASQNQAAKMQ